MNDSQSPLELTRTENNIEALHECITINGPGKFAINNNLCEDGEFMGVCH